MNYGLQRINFTQSPLHTYQKEGFVPPHVIWGATNIYPAMMRDIVSRSSTAKACAKWLYSFLRGDGFLDSRLDKVVFNKEKKITGVKLLDIIAQQVAFIPAITFHLDFNIYGQIARITPIPIDFCRVGGASKSNEYTNQMAIWDNWAGESAKMFDTIANIQYFPRFGFSEPNEFGSVYYENLEPHRIYPNAISDSVQDDMEFDFKVAKFRNRTADNNFTPSTIAEVLGAKSGGKEIEEVKKSMQYAQGAENAGSILFIGGGAQDENGVWRSAINFTTPQFADFGSVYETQVGHAESRIMSAFNLPSVLLALSKSASGLNSNKDMIADSFELYNMFTQDLREKITEALNPIISNFVGEEVDCTIKPKTFLKPNTDAGVPL